MGDMERQVVGFGEGDEVKLDVKVMGGGEELRRVEEYILERVYRVVGVDKSEGKEGVFGE